MASRHLLSPLLSQQPSFVYILASRKVGTLYIGVTTDLAKRISEHCEGIYSGFTFKYSVHMLVYYEVHNSVEAAIQRDRRMKKWERAWKIQLIEKSNPYWEDLFCKIAS